MWIVATLLEFQETEPESPVAEGNMQVQNIIFHLYSTCCLPFIFAARASWQEEQCQEKPTLLCRGQGWHCHSDMTGCALPSATAAGTQPARTLSRWMLHTPPQLSSSEKKGTLLWGKLVSCVTPTTLS